MNKIDIYEESKIYIVAPPNFATGGVELLHQLAWHLRNDLKIQTYIYYIPSNHMNPTHENYKIYNNPFTEIIENDERNILIIPELYQFIKSSNKYNKIRKIIWWLSVDNFYVSMFLFKKPIPFYWTIFKRFFSKKIYSNKVDYLQKDALNFYRNYDFKNDPIINSITLHLVQSEYAMKHLLEKKIDSNIEYLSDYLNNDFLNSNFDILEKQNIVVFNPKKGYEFTKKIIKSAKEIKFVPIENMKKKDVIELLKKSKVYIDFGNHPGKDRIPREAAILGCCVITGTKGSAKYSKDICIPDEYKIEDRIKNIPIILDRIKNCINDYEKHENDFEPYVKKIKEEPELFLKNLKKIFIRI